MSFSNFLENKVGDKAFRNTDFTVTTVYAALHDDDPGETGTNEVTGGSYARQTVTFDAFASGASANAGALNFTLMPAGDVVALSLWDASTAGNCLATGWLGGQAAKVFTSAATDTITSPGHGYSDNDRVVFDAEDAGSLPTGMTAGVLYYVISSATDTFQISATQGGAAVDLTTVGSGKVRKVVPKTLNLNDTLQIAIGDLDLIIY